MSPWVWILIRQNNTVSVSVTVGFTLLNHLPEVYTWTFWTGQMQSLSHRCIAAVEEVGLASVLWCLLCHSDWGRWRGFKVKMITECCAVLLVIKSPISLPLLIIWALTDRFYTSDVFIVRNSYFRSSFVPLCSRQLQFFEAHAVQWIVNNV